MYTYNQYKKIFKKGSYSKYLLRQLKKCTVDAVKSSYLCLRFPFLYPRNRFSDKHYTNWKLRDKRYKIFKKQSEWANENKDEYIDKFGYESVFFEGDFVKSEYVMKLAPIKDRFFYWFYGFYERFLELFHFIPTYTELDSMDSGWRKRFGIQFCKELKTAIKQSPDKSYMKNFRIIQIKEKWGMFECYVNMYSPEVSRVINKYNYISQFVCVRCGKDAVKKTLGWICPYCEDCLPKDTNWVWIDKVYGWIDTKHEKENKEKLKDIY